MQSQKHSVYEAWTNGVVGFLLSWMIMAVWLYFPLEPKHSFIVTLSFTGVSIARSYIIRRIYNGIGRSHHHTST